MPWVYLKGNVKKHLTVLDRHKRELLEKYPSIDFDHCIVMCHPDTTYTNYWFPTPGTQPYCGHPRSAVVGSDEGTNYCKECEEDAK